MAIELTPNEEQKAFSSLMVYVINRNKYRVIDIKEDGIAARKYARDFNHLKSTTAFVKYGCEGIDNFIAAR